MKIIDRQAARGILLTPDDEVLLIRVAVQNGSFWICPGGGIQPGETAEEALRRELAEETGLSGATIGPLIWKRRHELTMHGNRWRQSEQYFIVPCRRFAPRMRDAAEARITREFRWWRPDGLRQDSAAVTPAALLRIVMDYRAYGPPRGPLATEIVRD
ncbi:ADP-ribose pyrophosphatase YjhB, NUDIX family [Paracoccus halophilus]|uniref:ADP-ribose pyrophosphatase YjhB, NUDIX family n=1 Tax=Paracoccus halophilus TaxID=376733 RepID=A0A099F7D9_9RHOB|nr:NUDIX domain-containing protein [Paracoccus halophilus]KGJ06404.1 NUDIX hydrolase [Paracoccus halophilus]SFA38576.1 ADP-ribose pyrophosphatase YjhB, NUDIX family [Paracoccus halophilus]